MTISTLATSLTQRTSRDGSAPAASAASIRVLVFLPNSVSRWGVCSMFHALDAVGEVTGCETDDEALRLLSGSPDVLVVSDTLTDEQLDALGTVAQDGGTRLVMLLQQRGEAFHPPAGTRHVDGFLLEAALSPDTIADSLERLLRGEMPMPATLAKSLLSRAGGRARPSTPDVYLTPRERQTLALLVDGCSNKQIAHRLCISENGAKRHVANVLAKLNCPNRTLAVAQALRDGLVQKSA